MTELHQNRTLQKLSGKTTATDTGADERHQLVHAIERLHDSQQLTQALSLCQKLNRCYADYAHGWYLASCLMYRVTNFKDALTAIEQAILCLDATKRLDQNKYQLQRARCLFAAGDRGTAASIADELREVTFSGASLHHDFANLLNDLEQVDLALAQFDKAIQMDSAPAAFHYNKATMQRYLGDITGAALSFSAAIERDPLDYEAYYARSNLNKQSVERNSVQAIELAIEHADETPKKNAKIHCLYYALAKEQEDLGNFTASFAALSRASALKRGQMQYDVNTDLAILKAIGESYGPAMFDGHIQGCDSPDPIFILGMPRTGTTLVERILASHSDVCAAGELNNFALELMNLVKNSGLKPRSRIELIELTQQLDFQKLGQNYLSSVKSLGLSKPYFIDKLPFNYLYTGLIHLALPRAKIINLQRNPMDTCYAVFKQLFKDAYPFSYDLLELGRYYVAYTQLMTHWNVVLPGVIHTVKYEQLVADTESETRRLLDYCGLSWQDQCLQFHTNESASKTASATQVRQPVYRSSIGKWRAYEQQLQPLRKLLGEAGIVMDDA